MDIVAWVFNELGCTEGLTREYIKEALRDICIFDRKQRDYGPENIATFGEKGVVVHMNDKMARLRNLVWGDKPASNEAVEDSYADLSVYGVIARMCRAGVWPGVPVETCCFDRPGAPVEWPGETPWVDPNLLTPTIWTNHALQERPESVSPDPQYDACNPLHHHEPDHWEDTPSEVDCIVYWCPSCKRVQLAERQDGGFDCSICHQFLFGPSLGSVRKS